MTFLELCQELHAEAGYSGSITTTSGLSGQMGRIVRWIRNANIVLQSEHTDWTFLTREFSFDTTVGKRIYSLTDLAAAGVENVASWHKSSMRIQSGTDDSTPLRNLHRQRFMHRYANPREGRPIYWTRGLDGGIELSHAPDAVYTITGQFQREPASLSLDGDIPVIPEKHHIAIVWKGLSYYGTHEEAPLSVQRGEGEYRKELHKMRAHYLPDVVLRGAFS